VVKPKYAAPTAAATAPTERIVMKKFFNGLLLGLLLGAGAYWFLEKKARQHPEAESRFEESAAKARDAAREAALHVTDAFKAKLDTLKLRPEDIQEELARTGKVVRRKSPDTGEPPADAAADARAVAAIKAKLAADTDLSALGALVVCERGQMTLSARDATPQQVAKALTLALELGGVRDATFALEPKPKDDATPKQ
jgi:hypothetical protein